MKSNPASSDSVKRYNCAQSRLKRKRECTTEEAVTKAGMAAEYNSRGVVRPFSASN